MRFLVSNSPSRWALTSLAVLGLLVSCGGGGSPEPPPVSDVDVYVAGYDSQGTKIVPRVWKNGTPLGYSVPDPESKVLALAVSGSQVYSTGYSLSTPWDPSQHRLMFWLNAGGGQVTNGPEDAHGFAIAISGSDVYIGGQTLGSTLSDTSGHGATIWKNNVPTYLTSEPTNSSVKALVVSGGDVFAAGRVEPNGVLWKNGVVAMEKAGAYFEGLCISGEDTYVCGNMVQEGGYWTAVLWKNGDPTFLAPGAIGSSAKSVLVSGNDVYVCGWRRLQDLTDQMVVWKNGVAMVLPAEGFFELTGMTICKGSLYVSGIESLLPGGNLTASYATVWKDGVATRLTAKDHQGGANAIVVIPKP